MTFPRDSAFGQENERLARMATKAVVIPPKHADEKPEHKAPFEHWHHDLVTVDTLLDQRPPEVERARALLLEVADEIHVQFESVRGKRNQ